jgi:hypothetical protein
MGPEARLQGFPVDHINRASKQTRDVIFQTRVVEHRRDNCGVKVNQNIDVAVWPLLVAGHGTEQCRVRDAMRPQVGLALLQRPYDLVTFHAVSYTTEPSGPDGLSSFHSAT